jgi:hypothetical protein
MRQVEPSKRSFAFALICHWLSLKSVAAG